MLVRVSDYFERFQCLAGACPHTCCAKWDVVIDEESAALYQTVSGELGEELRERLRRDEEGDLCFSLCGERCPFLNGENLCRIHLQLGEEATSITCREHPRFTEDYGAFREITLSASCPEANRLLLESEAPLTFREMTVEEPEEEGDEWLEILLPLRRQMLDILQDRSRPLRARMRAFLAFAEQAQAQLDADCFAVPPEAEPCRDGHEEAEEDGEGIFPHVLRLLAQMEALDGDWREILRSAEAAGGAECPQPLLERIGTYAAFRYLLKAVNDGDLLSRARLCVVTVLVVERLAAVCGLPEALRRFSCEIEHSGENLDALLDACRQSETISPERLRHELCAE